MFAAILSQPYLFVVIMSVLASAVVYFYSKTTEKMDGRESANKAFFKTLAASLMVGILLAYLSKGGSGGGAQQPSAVSAAGQPEPFFQGDTGVPAI